MKNFISSFSGRSNNPKEEGIKPPATAWIVTRRLTRVYLIALGLIAALSIAIFFLLLGIIRTQEHIAAVINTSGRQRMLSQRVALYGLKLVESETPLQREENRIQLLDAVDTMETVHDLLHVSGGTFEGQTLPKPSEEVLSIFFGPRGNLDEEIKTYLSEARELASDPDDLLTIGNVHLKSILDAADARILEELDEVVDEYQSESDTTVTGLQYALVASVVAIILALAMEGVFIFRRMVSRIRREAGQLEQAYEQQRRIAETLQDSLISGEIPVIKNLEIGLFYKSATAAAEAGGDFYDFIRFPGGGWGIVLGDVAGKGIDAAVEPVKVRELMNDRVLRGLPPEALLESINDTLVQQHTEMFIAITYASFFEDRAVLNLINAGNPYPLLLSSKRFVELSEPPLAAAEGTKYSSLDVPFKPGETILFYTDGLAQVETADGVFFGLQLDRYVTGKEDLSPDQLVHSLVEEALRLSGGQLFDDILVMAVRRKA